jgi:hypothetical protein
MECTKPSRAKFYFCAFRHKMLVEIDNRMVGFSCRQVRNVYFFYRHSVPTARLGEESLHFLPTYCSYGTFCLLGYDEQQNFLHPTLRVIKKYRVPSICYKISYFAYSSIIETCITVTCVSIIQDSPI